MLRNLGWRVAIVWECSLKHSVKDTAQIMEKWLHSEEAFLEVGASLLP